MKLSIITVNLNNAAGLKKTAESIVSQSFHDFEWIVIDGGSTDGSKELIEQYSDHIAYWVSEKDSGIYNAMNKGVQHANGEYVQFLNSGDWLSSCNILDEAFTSRFNEDIVYGNIYFYKDSFLVATRVFPKVIGLDFFIESSLGHNSCFVKLEHMVNNPFDEKMRIVSDWKFFLLELLKGSTFRHIDVNIGCFDMSGISETMRDLVKAERLSVIEEVSTQIITYKTAQNAIVSSFLANVAIEEFVELCQHHKILKKVITAVVLFMQKINF